jgi:hypothetical protein
MIGRPRGSVEYKHRNIGAVLKGLGEDWIPRRQARLQRPDRARAAAIAQRRTLKS